MLIVLLSGPYFISRNMSRIPINLLLKSMKVLFCILYCTVFIWAVHKCSCCVNCVCSISRCTLRASRRCLTFSACGQVVHTLSRCAVSPIMAFGVNGVLLPTLKSLTVRHLPTVFYSTLHSAYTI